MNFERLDEIAEQLEEIAREIRRLKRERANEESKDVLFLAAAIQGEGAGLFSDRVRVGRWIAHTAINLFEAPWQNGRWASVADVVRDRFHGHAGIGAPDPWAIDIARLALGEHDITGGALAMLSGNDLRNRGWPQRYDIMLREFHGPQGHSLFFYGTWAKEWDA